MNNNLRRLLLSTFALLLTLGACGPSLETQARSAAAGEELYYAIAMRDTVFGYTHLTASPLPGEGRTEVLLHQDIFVKASLLGVGLDSESEVTYHLDPEGRRFSYFASEVRQGPIHRTAEASVEGDAVRFSSSLLGREKTVPLGEDVLLENTLFHPHLKADFADRDLAEKTYRLFEVDDAAVQEVTYRRVGDETLELLGRSWDTVVLDRLNRVTGFKARLWIGRERGLMLQSRGPDGALYYLTDAGVPKRIKSAAVDDNILHETEVSIADIQAISYMQVEARLEPRGSWITPEDLNVPGQRFTGTVEENLIEGVFEIEHRRYDGAGAPPFPPDFSGEPELARNLGPRAFIEADDPELVARARQVTAGATDSWQAATRIARWVSENVEYAIPGGVTARGVYDSRAGECGGHSFLVAALSRAAGIPARVVWGAMFTPHRGGAFGQHGWNEVYMGEAGWVPLDATAAETDHLDSGHIRLGVYRSLNTALNPIALEVLDYRLGTAKPAAELTRYEPYVGKYRNRDAGMTVEVRVQDGSLTLDIPDQTLLALHDPDPDGCWFAKLSNRLFVTFSDNGPAGAGELRLHERLRMRRTGTPDEVPGTVPPELAAYLGTYHLAKARADFTVLYRRGGLALRQPGVGRDLRLEPQDEEGRWVDELGRRLRFETGAAETVAGLEMEAITPFVRGET